MSADDEIFIKLEISRDKTSGELAIIIRLKKSAPNLFVENNNIEWFPTIMEKNLINDTFDLFSNKKTTNSSTLNNIKSESDSENEDISDDNKILPKNTSSDEKVIIDKVLIQKKEQI